MIIKHLTEKPYDPAKAAKLKYTDCSVEILNFIHSKEDEDSGSPYNCGFDVCVRSGAFAGRADGCEYDYKAWNEFVNRLEELYRFKTDRAELREIGYGSSVLFSGDGAGHIEISGTIYGNRAEQTLEFRFAADRTALPPFLEKLKEF
ncbi:MAG: hypothetical protein IJU52_06240 [Clostridia bacterium]|nr:hypothetical protein [Clostridia bacterium]